MISNSVVKYLFIWLVMIELQSNYSDAYNQFKALEHKNWPKSAQDVCGTTSTNRIVGGVDAKLGQFPWIAQIGVTCKNFKQIKQLPLFFFSFENSLFSYLIYK